MLTVKMAMPLKMVFPFTSALMLPQTHSSTQTICVLEYIRDHKGARVLGLRLIIAGYKEARMRRKSREPFVRKNE